MLDINDPGTLAELRGGVLSHLRHFVGFCVARDREFVTAAVRAQFGVELQVISLGTAAPESVWGLTYAPQTWRGKSKSVLQQSSENDQGELEGFIRGLNYCRQGADDVAASADVPAFARVRHPGSLAARAGVTA
jgi:hypothetical protein